VPEVKLVWLVMPVLEVLTVLLVQGVLTAHEVFPELTDDRVNQAQTEKWVHEVDQVHQPAPSV
jgi:hypothetical protein